MPSRPPATQGPRALVAGFERTIDPSRRRRVGAHYTPDGVARPVLDLALDALGALPRTVCDPTCGGGAFLLTVAQRLLEMGVPADDIVRRRLVGLELDPSAVAVAREALSAWATDHGAAVAPCEVQVHVGDALALAPQQWPARPADGFDLVIGNPPFLSQLSRRTVRSTQRRRAVSDRLGPVGAYTDDAGLFLLAAVDLVAPDGVVAMLQPQSVLSSRDARPVRAGLSERCALVGLWAHAGTPFPDAEVQVCAPVLRRTARPSTEGECDVQVVWQVEDSTRRSVVGSPTSSATWGGVLAPSLGVPEVPLLLGRRLGEVAATTAGFRDEYYALCAALVGPSVSQAGADGVEDDPDRPRVISVGMIDPGWVRWGTGPHRMGGAAVESPRVDLELLDAESPRVGRWARARLVPKVLVAAQTKVVEAVVDETGGCVPLTPVISVEPTTDVDVWHLMAALTAPPVAAAVARDHLGAGRTVGALRWSARGVAAMPLPTDERLWARGAELARLVHLDEHAAVGSSSPVPPLDAQRRSLLVDELGATMTRAYGLDEDHPVASWWSARRPRR